MREGRVEVCNDGWWGQLCESRWDNNDAKVVCRQLGLLSADTGKFVVSVLFGLIPVTSIHIGLAWTALICFIQNIMTLGRWLGSD